jgi:hypothetical protein
MGIKVQIRQDLQLGEPVTVCYGSRRMSFKVVWIKPEKAEFLAGLVSLVQPLEWGPAEIATERRGCLRLT